MAIEAKRGPGTEQPAINPFQKRIDDVTEQGSRFRGAAQLVGTQRRLLIAYEKGTYPTRPQPIELDGRELTDTDELRALEKSYRETAAIFSAEGKYWRYRAELAGFRVPKGQKDSGKFVASIPPENGRNRSDAENREALIASEYHKNGHLNGTSAEHNGQNGHKQFDPAKYSPTVTSKELVEA